MHDPKPDQRTPGTEAGFALVLSLMALVLLTFLGLTLATTTSTELQIATNYRYSQMAYYAAESGIEVGKRYLRSTDWRAVLPPARNPPPAADMNAPPPPLVSRPGPEGEPSRNLELVGCDNVGNTGYVVVLDNPNEVFPYQNSSTLLGQTINGTFTLWVRRPLITDASGSYDNPDDLRLILTSEGTAPFQQGASTTGYATANRAVRYLEVQLQRVEAGDCENRTAQAGSGPAGSGFDQCDPVRAAGIGLPGGPPVGEPNAQIE
jgi:hypothetical protein